MSERCRKTSDHATRVDHAHRRRLSSLGLEVRIAPERSRDGCNLIPVSRIHNLRGNTELLLIQLAKIGGLERSAVRCPEEERLVRTPFGCDLRRRLASEG